MSGTEITDRGKKDAPEPTWKVENVVCTANVDIESKIDLNSVARGFPESQYNPERFPGLITRFENPKAAVLLFSTGKMVITGLRSSEHANDIVDKVCKMLKRAKVSINGKPEITVQNIVSSGSLGLGINLDEAAVTLDNAVYEPEVFPGLIYRMEKPKVVILLFSTGRFVVTGARNKDQIKEAVDTLLQDVKREELQQELPEDDDYYL